MSANNNKLKVLLFGRLTDAASVELFLAKLKALQSKRPPGPFDAAFVVGSSTAVACRELIAAVNDDSSAVDLPPVYLHHVAQEDVDEMAVIEEEEDGDKDGSPVVSLGRNLYVLQSKGGAVDGDHDEGDKLSGIWSLPIRPPHVELVVASCAPRFKLDQSKQQSILTALDHVSFVGCDLLLTHEFPQGTEQVLPAIKDVSFDVAEVALKARARYHAVPSSSAEPLFHQSKPFSHLRATTSTVDCRHVGRLLGLPPLSSNKEKAYKSVHALGITPLLLSSADELERQRPKDTVPCPFTDVAYPTDERQRPKRSLTIKLQNTGLSEASARRILEQERRGGDSHRWHDASRKRPLHEEQREEEMDESNTTLFLHGLHKDVTGQLRLAQSGDAMLMHALERFQPVRVRRPTANASSSFCFVEFASHAKALHCWKELAGQITITGVDLTVRWSSRSGTEQSGFKRAKAERLTEEEAKDSSTVYFKLVATDGELDNAQKISTALREWSEKTLEDALNTVDTAEEDRVTAKDEPALAVELRRQREDDRYGFLEFASHAAASMAIATLTTSTDGGMVMEEETGGDAVVAKKRPSVLRSVRIYLHWAKGGRQSTDKDIIQDADSGFTFERKHFPADSRSDCWFCLASESCEKHLITGVYDSCYSAMPKGPVHPGHILLIPVQHDSQGALKDPTVSTEIEALKAKLRKHAVAQYDKDLFVFERAIQTKGGYHTHVHCIPVDKKAGPRLQATMVAQGKRSGMNLRELSSDLSLSSVLGEDSGYFYAEIPFGSEYKRFLHKTPAEPSVPSSSVPIQFGREVLAAVLENPKLAHWKSCLVDTEQEKVLAAELRKSLAEVM